MSGHCTFVQGMVNIFWRKYVHRYATYNHTTMTSKSPLSPHFRAVSCTAIEFRSIRDCSVSKELQSYNSHIANIIVIDQMV